MSEANSPSIDQELLRKVLESSPFFRHLKMEFVDAADGVARLSLTVQPFHINTQGIVQGGVLCSLADVVGLLAVGTRLSLGQRPRTVQMDVHFLAPAKEGTLVAVGRIAKMGTLVSVSDVEIQDETGKTVCMARCTSVLVSVAGDEKFSSQ
ncbi:MAG: PaaI family thioesterase [Deltaproteobacteria bacterium]|nr:PaaI family thioesterase [Deltaproteobacteria bacterium]